MLVDKTSCQSPWYGQIDVEDSAASFAVEMMVGLDISVIAGCADRTRHLVDLTPGDEHFEISVHSPE